jgi:hypothetical protein
VIAEIAEFAYSDDARLFVVGSGKPETQSQVSAGQLWTTKGDWSWRVWSISSTGDVTFSEARQFRH